MKKFAPVVAAKEFRPLQVTASEVDNSFDRMLKRFVRRTREDGIIDEVRSRIGFRKPSEHRRAAKRARR